MPKVVYNNCYGGFGLSKEATNWLKTNYPEIFNKELQRHDPRLVECVETLKEKASTKYSKLEIAEIDGRLYRIEDYDGKETIVEPDDLDWIIINHE